MTSESPADKPFEANPNSGEVVKIFGDEAKDLYRLADKAWNNRLDQSRSPAYLDTNAGYFVTIQRQEKSLPVSGLAKFLGRTEPSTTYVVDLVEYGCSTMFTRIVLDSATGRKGPAAHAIRTIFSGPAKLNLNNPGDQPNNIHEINLDLGETQDAILAGLICIDQSSQATFQDIISLHPEQQLCEIVGFEANNLHGALKELMAYLGESPIHIARGAKHGFVTLGRVGDSMFEVEKITLAATKGRLGVICLAEFKYTSAGMGLIAYYNAKGQFRGCRVSYYTREDDNFEPLGLNGEQREPLNHAFMTQLRQNNLALITKK